MSNKYSQKPLGSAKKARTDAIKTDPKRAIQKSAEATGNLIGNKISDKITNISKSPKEFYSKELNSKELHSKTNENEIELPKEIHISPKKNKQQTIDELRLV